MTSRPCRHALLAVVALILPAAPGLAAPPVRAGDRTSHGGVVASASPNVFIEDQAAARGEDRAVCPLSTGGVPHVGGSIFVGGRTVFINGRPAVRTGDTVAELGASSAIVTGAASVNIGP